MAFDDLREKLLDQWNHSLSELQDSPTFNNLKERYQTLPANIQRLVITGAIGLVAMIFLSIPYAFFSAADDSLVEFAETRSMIRGLMKAGRLKQAGGEVPRGPEIQALPQMVEATAHAGILPEQFGQAVPFDPKTVPSMILPGFEIFAVSITLKSLNLHQVVGIAHKLQSMNSAVKLGGLEVNASASNDHYFDTTFKVFSYVAPEIPGGE